VEQITTQLLSRDYFPLFVKSDLFVQLPKSE
jgi:hypothetical protein